MKNKIFLIFIGLILSFNIFANMTSKEKLELAVKYSKEKKFSEVEKLYLDLIKEKNLVAMRYLAYMYSQWGKVLEEEKYYKMAADRGSKEAAVEYDFMGILEEHNQ